MGAFFDSIHVRTENSDALQKALWEVAKQTDFKFLLGPALNGWMSVFPSEIGREGPIAAEIAKLINCDVFHLMVYDDDVFYYHCYRDAKLVDQYNSNPDYFEADSEEENQLSRGRPELFNDLLPDPKSLAKLKKLLGAERFTFESERMSTFVELLGFANALTCYDYLQEGSQDEIEGWDQFIHIEFQPHSAEDFNQRGEVKLVKNDFEGAAEDFHKALTLNPDLVIARDNTTRANDGKKERNKKIAQGYTLVGRKCRESGDLDSALTHFNKAIELDPELATAYSSRGIVKKSKGDLDGALADFNKAIELKEDLPVTYMRRAAIKDAKGDSEGAIADYNRSIELKPDSAMAYNNRGELKRRKRDLDGAVSDYNRAIELKPDSALYHSNRALVKLAKKDLEGALADCNRAIELKGDLGVAYNNRGMVKQVKGDLTGALEDYDRAIGLNPDIAAFRTNRDKAMQMNSNQKL